MPSPTLTADLPARRAATVIGVASVPASHVYVRHLSAPDGVDDGVVRLPDPPTSGRSEQSQWWPPTMLAAAWVHRHHESFDVFHVHFGFDARTPAELADLVDALRTHGKPLVLTVHDLRNPHHADRREHDAQLDVLVPAAQGLVTLTRGAAAEIAGRWGRWPTVIAHPHVVEVEQMAQLQAGRTSRPGRTARVGLHLKSVRAGMDPRIVLPALVRAVEGIEGAVLQVNGHAELLEPGGRAYDAELAGLVHDLGDRIDLRVHEYFTDDELWAYLSSLDVSVLPYRFGTHSGWLEACRDVGTAVVAPSCGYYADQGPVETYLLDEDLFDESTLEAAVRRALVRAEPAATVADRERQRLEVAVAHRRLYESLLA
ncbi:glycosyltransferase family 1 protein [Aeromicrobium fastidiosum]|uniref:glycosyltransferase family 1 protein n=1 Tax=Aeromicrobium fastidiosum TaxID=52699 RepID=UPI00202389BB|nr:glycosyltransferase family 1 protein [Aeromicrobium fastidiosum]MCL8252175.1 glycosyltransferase family 1 protein [Aeromicrobium fastidiosum]